MQSVPFLLGTPRPSRSALHTAVAGRAPLSPTQLPRSAPSPELLFRGRRHREVARRRAWPQHTAGSGTAEHDAELPTLLAVLCCFPSAPHLWLFRSVTVAPATAGPPAALLPPERDGNVGTVSCKGLVKWR